MAKNRRLEEAGHTADGEQFSALLEAVLTEHFPRGYRLGSSLEYKKFRRYYETLTGQALDLPPEEAEQAIQTRGIVYDGRVFMPQVMLSTEMRQQLLSYIDQCLSDGKTVLYYEALFQTFSEKLLDHNIYNSDMLKAYLSHTAGDQYYLGRTYLSSAASASTDPVDDIRVCLKEYGMPMAVRQLCRSLPHIPDVRVKSILVSNGEFIRNHRGEYFHADALHLTDSELEWITTLICDAIQQQKFISGNELVDAIKAKYPHIFEANSAFSMIGWRDALKYKLRNRFSFAGNIISRLDDSLTMSDVFADFAKTHSSFTMAELTNLKESIGSSVYFDALYKNAVRISEEQYVAKNSVRFQVKATDAVLDRLCTGRYLPLPKVTEFGAFPDASHPWTAYLLEQYVAFFSEKYYLLHGGYNNFCIAGAMVKRTCVFSSFDELIADALANSGIPLQKKSALDYLVDNGYLARRSHMNIETILIHARAQRNQKERE